MQLTTYIFATFAIVSAALAVPVDNLVERDTKYCGYQPYEPSKYTCYDGLLCPIQNYVVYKRCGGDCYDPAKYVCHGTKMCPTTDPNLCGDACYNSSRYKCEYGRLVQV
ncbi:unnamed protein product [Tuber melanosporum]|jgi:hypothetical protein|uniref:(Perigord truffle) hypothetical protein n=1 Tax=Tuber melanosporum (strain Mel28) TaxID=656061 RepID=D5GF49_TUBMM|nr:uncharacterized protein GSTUM_00001850001 [Tuber melanosporum]CAZ83142.1 unnamed protein product [Tuber melanosporum]